MSALGVRSVLLAAVLATLAASASGLRCWQCGQYNEGVGSITPCTNATGARLENCAPEHKYCIKYVSELTTVRDCVPTCTEKESWGAKSFCCETDECNGAGRERASGALLLPALLLANIRATL